MPWAIHDDSFISFPLFWILCCFSHPFLHKSDCFLPLLSLTLILFRPTERRLLLINFFNIFSRNSPFYPVYSLLPSMLLPHPFVRTLYTFTIYLFCTPDQVTFRSFRPGLSGRVFEIRSCLSLWTTGGTPQLEISLQILGGPWKVWGTESLAQEA